MSDGLAAALAEVRRLIILRAIEQDRDYQLSEDVLKRVLLSMKHIVSRETVRQDIAWLEQQELVRVEQVDGAPPVRIVHALETGIDVARGLVFPGVARLYPGERMVAH